MILDLDFPICCLLLSETVQQIGPNDYQPDPVAGIGNTRPAGIRQLTDLKEKDRFLPGDAGVYRSGEWWRS